MSFGWRADRVLFVIPLVFSPTAFLPYRTTHRNLRFRSAERLRPARQRCTSKRQLLHDRHVLSWQELLVGIDRGQIRSIFILCGATAGNLGAILRTSTLLDISAVCILEGTSKATLDKAFRFSMLEQRNHWDTLVVPAPFGEGSGETPLLDLKQRGVKLVGMVARDAVKESPYDLWDLDLSTGPLAFVFGADEEDGSAFTKETGQIRSFTIFYKPVPSFHDSACNDCNFINPNHHELSVTINIHQP